MTAWGGEGGAAGLWDGGGYRYCGWDRLRKNGGLRERKRCRALLSIDWREVGFGRLCEVVYMDESMWSSTDDTDMLSLW